jgi:hypothetical protein
MGPILQRRSYQHLSPERTTFSLPLISFCVLYSRKFPFPSLNAIYPEILGDMEKDLEIEAPEHTGDAPINASGHRQELDRNFRLIEICGLGITSGNTWIAIGGSIVRFLFSGE